MYLPREEINPEALKCDILVLDTNVYQVSVYTNGRALAAAILSQKGAIPASAQERILSHGKWYVETLQALSKAGKLRKIAFQHNELTYHNAKCTLPQENEFQRALARINLDCIKLGLLVEPMKHTSAEREEGITLAKEYNRAHSLLLAARSEQYFGRKKPDALEHVDRALLAETLAEAKTKKVGFVTWDVHLATAAIKAQHKYPNLHVLPHIADTNILSCLGRQKTLEGKLK